MSVYSPGPISDSEQLSRYVFSPMHVDKKGNIKSSVFSHVSHRGCSVQRESIAEDQEMIAFVESFLSKRDDYKWLGVLVANVADLRSLKVGETGNRSVCAYDTAEKTNPAHAELFQSQYVVEEADEPELRTKLFQAFGRGVLIAPNQYRESRVLDVVTSASN